MTLSLLMMNSWLFLVLFYFIAFAANASPNMAPSPESRIASTDQDREVRDFTLTTISPDGIQQAYPLYLRIGDSVHAFIQPHCIALNLQYDDCKELEDNLSEKLYQVGQTNRFHLYVIIFVHLIPSCHRF